MDKNTAFISKQPIGGWGGGGVGDGGRTPILDLTGMIVVIAVLVTLRVSREEIGENGNF